MISRSLPSFSRVYLKKSLYLKHDECAAAARCGASCDVLGVGIVAVRNEPAQMGGKTLRAGQHTRACHLPPYALGVTISSM